MRRDIGGWETRLTDEMIDSFTRSGDWDGLTLIDHAERRLAAEDDGLVLIDGDRSIPLSDLVTDAQALAAALQAQGLNPGDVISFQLPNWAEAAVINLAACFGGFVINPIVPIYRTAEVRYMLRDGGAKAFFIPESFRNFDYASMAAELRDDLPDLKSVIVVRGGHSAHEQYDAVLEKFRGQEPERHVQDANAVKLLLYTSGTTGAPKGVLHSHNTIGCELRNVTDEWRIAPEDRMFMPSPVTHVTGFLYALELPIVTGCAAILMEKWEAGAAVDLVKAHGGTHTVGATPFLQELTAACAERKEGLPSLRLFACGGAPVPPEVIHRCHEALDTCVAMRICGSSECPTHTLGIRGREEEELGATTDGRIVGQDIRIVDAGSGEPVPEGEEGEICARGPEICLGYASVEHTAGAFDADGFFHTGDLGKITHGEFVTITGRKKDLIIRGGENISPKEIEDILHTHPEIREAAVVAMPHARLGEGVCAYLILEGSAKADQSSVAAFLIDAGLAKQKIPERVEVVPDFPRTASGKIQKNLLRDRITEQIEAEAG